MLLQRVVTALILLVLILGSLFFMPPWVWGVLSLTLMAAGAWEWGVLIGKSGQAERMAMRVAGAVALAGLAYLAWRGQTGPPSVWLVALLLVNLIVWLGIAIPAVLAARIGGANPAFAILAMLCVWAALYELRLADPWLVLSAMAIVWCADVGAYFFGRAFGRRKLAPRVSPGKSWEGAVGGALTALVVAVLVWWLRPGAPVLTSLLVESAGLVLSLVGIVVIVAVSVIGDLYESLLKRSKGVKDSGKLLPGHGGVLDRIDALIPTMPLCLLLWVALSK